MKNTNPKTREQMTAPLTWHEQQLATVWRYGVRADGSIGFELVKAPERHQVYRSDGSAVLVSIPE
jgi:hypothetical protein